MGRVYLKNITPSIARPRSSSERKGRKKQNGSPRGQMLKSFLTEIQVEGVEWDRCFFLERFVQNHQDPVMMGKCGLPPLFLCWLIFPFFHKVFEEIESLGYFWVLL